MNVLKTIVFIFAVLSLPIPSGGAAVDEFTLLRYKSSRGNIIHGALDAGCSACHTMSGGSGGLNDKEEWACLLCHSSARDREAEQREIAQKRPDLRKGLVKTDILNEYRKTFTHPTLRVSGVHAFGEFLPEKDPKAQRHAECVDCHNHHEVSRFNKLGPVRVTGAFGESKKLKGLKDMMRDEEFPDYELCFNCHSDSANLPLNQTNKRVELNIGNPSYHPVLGEGKNMVVPSLKPPYSAMKKRPTDISIIKCGDCHGNDDPKGPKGPHGSIYPHILAANYSVNDSQPESSFQYALCYECHDRLSIMRNDSFRYHSLHIQGNPKTGSMGTSCYTCHNSHGSTENRFLIRFNRDVVFSNLSSGQLRFVSTGTFRGECYLSCHGVSHNPKRY